MQRSQNLDNEPIWVVGLGASAGGLEPLEQFFAGMPDDSGLAFVVVVHQERGHRSLLPQILGGKTRMPVVEVDQETEVRPNHVYTIAPGSELTLSGNVLRPDAPNPELPRRLPIDHFFRSLAEAREDRAIAIILSGSGSDGTQGLKAIKAQFGLVIVQQASTAEFSGMPDSALSTLLVDCILPPAEMPKQLLWYVNAGVKKPVEELGEDRQPNQDVLEQILSMLRLRTGHDFAQYKSSTVRRRIDRRMHVRHVTTVSQYAKVLQEIPGEIDLLFKELLIGVTSFFRDPESFAVLGGALKHLIQSKADDQVIRLWVPGCSTGEEAYSLAILLKECMAELDKPLGAQIFASDLDPTAISAARLGLYPVGIAAEVSPERLRRFFVREENGYRIRKDIRESLIFAPQNMIGDPPFTKLDLLSCRNLLIYLDGKLQKRLLPMFHYALRPDGILFLGSSESIGTFEHLFMALDKRSKVFRRREGTLGSYNASFLSADAGAVSANPVGVPRPSQPPTQSIDRLLLRELVPPTVVVQERGEVIHIHGRTGLFLEPQPGAQGLANVLQMAREGLHLEIATALRQCVARREAVVYRDLHVKSNGGFVRVDLLVKPAFDPASSRNLFLISFKRSLHEERGDPSSESEAANGHEVEFELEQDLRYAKESHQSVVEELKSANEELQSTNEELQSANEELETSKEELQSLNEELQTVNAELHSKVEELSRANDDMTNLLNGTEIATLFLDNQLNIKRYTEQTTRVIHLIPSDVGRPIGDLVSRLTYVHLIDDAKDVLRTLTFKETEVRGKDGSWYLLRILPYRTAENMIDGLVITFVDITTSKAARERERRLVAALRGSQTTVFSQDLAHRFIWASGSVFGITPELLIGKSDEEIFGAEQAAALIQMKKGVVSSGEEHRQQLDLTLDGKSRRYDFRVEAVKDADNTVIGVSCVVEDITDDNAGREPKKKR